MLIFFFFEENIYLLIEMFLCLDVLFSFRDVIGGYFVAHCCPGCCLAFRRCNLKKINRINRQAFSVLASQMG